MFASWHACEIANSKQATFGNIHKGEAKPFQPSESNAIAQLGKPIILNFQIVQEVPLIQLELFVKRKFLPSKELKFRN